MELLLFGLAAMLCAPLLEKKEEKPAPDKSGGDVIVIVIDKDGKPKT